MILGAKYEMYTPIARDAAQAIGLVFDDSDGYSFTYAGVVYMEAMPYICTPDVSYKRDKVPPCITPQLTALLFGEGMAHPLCPVQVAAKFVRPVTDE